MELSKVSNQKELEVFLKEKAKKHYHYKKYSSHILEIYDNGTIELSSGCNWDDEIDVNNIKNNKSKLFVTCFTCQQSENYLMWNSYCSEKESLYMIDISRKQMESITDKTKINVFLKDCENNEIEIKGKNEFELYLIDVIYLGKSKLNHREEYIERNKILNFDENKFYVKDYCHCDERECRLVLDFKNKKKYDKYKKAIIKFDKKILSVDDIRTADSKDSKYKQSEVYKHIKIECNNKKCIDKK